MVLFRKLAWLGVVLLALAGGPPTARAGETTVAVAASFAGVMADLARQFEATEGHHVVVVVGSSGKLASQILNGAPFDILLSADEARPAALIARGVAAPDDRFTYAIGRLALWSADARLLTAGGEAYLKAAGTRPVALANPKLAPYGTAALETLEALGLGEAMAWRLVYGENVGQAFALARSGAAEAAFVAWSQALNPEGTRGSFWLVPETLHRPVRQDGVLLARGKGNSAARAFIAFLGSMRARSVIDRAGFGG
jgi:molybdate transport system substrate-binding protein